MSIFGKAEKEQAFFLICSALANKEDEFQAISLADVYRYLPERWLSMDNIILLAEHYEGVQPYTSSLDNAKKVSPYVKKALESQ
jgi:aspartyl/asparaginyl beta-hydroxylase (cupin superfamily)